jgi:transcriptional regulator with XRE-family HTH domain
LEWGAAVVERYASFGQFLQKTRKLRGYDTQQQMRDALAKVGVEVSGNTFSRWETNEAVPRRAHLQALVKLLNLTEEEMTEAWRLFTDTSSEAA